MKHATDGVVLTIDMDRRCEECRQPGATPSGLCLRCVTKAITGAMMRTDTGRRVAAKFAVSKT